MSFGVFWCPKRDCSQNFNAYKTAELWEWPRGGMVDTKDLKDVASFLRIRSNFLINLGKQHIKDKVLCSTNVVSNE